MAGQMEQMGAILGQQLMKTAEVIIIFLHLLDGDNHNPLPDNGRPSGCRDEETGVDGRGRPRGLEEEEDRDDEEAAGEETGMVGSRPWGILGDPGREGLSFSFFSAFTKNDDCGYEHEHWIINGTKNSTRILFNIS